MVDLITVSIIAALAGFIGSLIGLGGGVIMIPTLVLLGVPVKFAIAASMITIIATSSGSASSYVRDRITNIRVAMYLEIFTIVGAIVGASITSIIAPRLLYFFFSGFLIMSFFGIRQHLGEEVLTGAVQDKLARWLGLEGSYYDKKLQSEVSYKITRPALGGVGMFVAGIAAGMLGIGAGAFKVSIHELIMRMPTKVSTTTSNFIIGMTALAGASVYFFSGLFYFNLAAPMMIGTTVGASIGARLLNRMKSTSLRKVFLVVVALLILQMLYSGVKA